MAKAPSYVTIKPKRANEDCKRPRVTENAALRASRRKRRPRGYAELEEVQLLYAIGSNPKLYPNAKVGWRPETPLTGAVLDRWVMGKMGCGEQQLKDYVRQLIAWQRDE